MPGSSNLVPRSSSKREAAYEQTGDKQRLFGEFKYAAATWDRERRVIIKAEHTSLGANTRFILTSLEGDPQPLYDEVYCARGDMENRIKEQQLDLYADRTSCHNWWPNQLRLMLSSLAYVLFDHIRRTALKNTRLATRHKCHHPKQTHPHRSRHRTQYPSHPLPLEYILSAPRALHARCRTPAINPEVCCPRHRKNNGGRWAEPARIQIILFIPSKKKSLPGDLCVLCAFARDKPSLMQHPG